MKPGPLQGRLRRPAPKTGILAEFVFGLLAGVLASFLLSLSLDVYNTQSSSPIAHPLRPLTTETKMLPPRPAVPRDGEWRARARLPGYKDPKIMCVITQNLKHDIVPGVINATWGSRCDNLVFASPRTGMDASKLRLFKTVEVEKQGEKDTTWDTYRSMLKNLDPEDSDYIIVVEDNTYGIPDNVRYEFRGFNPGSDPLFWGRKRESKIALMKNNQCIPNFFVLSRITLSALKNALDDPSNDACALKSHDLPSQLNNCLESVGSPCRPAIDFQGKQQIMDDPIDQLSKSDLPAHLMKGSDCCSVLPLAFLGVGKLMPIRTGTFSFHYFYDYFIRDTAVYGREYMRPLNGIDAGVGKLQVGF